MHATYGAYNRDMARRLDQFRIKFHAHHMPLRWVHSGLTADLCAAYYGVDFSRKVRKDATGISPEEISSVAQVIMNELFENAVKFHCPGDVSMASAIVNEDIIFLISNLATTERVLEFEKYLKKLMSEDTDSMLLEKVEASALAGTKESGLGFLMLMSDYGVLLGWELESVDKDTVQVKTMACLSMYKMNNTTVDSVSFRRRA
jgi:hypothetical protein